MAVILFVLLFLIPVGTEAESFTYGLWGRETVSVHKKEIQAETITHKDKKKEQVEFTWKDFLPKDLPAPFIKLLENPTRENVKRYWVAYEEFVRKVTEAGQMVRLLQVEYARKVSESYELIYFFSPKCSTCRKYTPELFISLLKEGFSLPVKAYVVGNVKEGRIYMSAFGVTTVRKSTGFLEDEYGVEALPTAVLLKDGEVVAKFAGNRVLDIVNLLKEKRDEAIASGSDAVSGEH